jgi:hypothetical protein
MSQYAYLSKPDPEFAALPKQDNPHLELPVDIPAAREEWIQNGQAPYAAYEKARLHPG